MKTNHHYPVRVTPAVLRYWWARLNRDCFQGALPRPRFVAAKLEAMGCYERECYGNAGAGKITVSTRVTSRGAMLATLAHEMVHQLQDLQGRPFVHGRFFNVIGRRVGRKIGVSIL